MTGDAATALGSALGSWKEDIKPQQGSVSLNYMQTLTKTKKIKSLL